MPAFLQNEHDDRLFKEIGRLTVLWAQLEFVLDANVNLIFHLYGNPGNEREVPTKSLERKVKFLRRAIRRMPIGETEISRFLDLLTRIKLEADFRHDIIHGAVTEHMEGTGLATSVRLIHGPTPKAKPVSLNPEVIRARYEAVLALATPFYYLAMGLADNAQPKPG